MCKKKETYIGKTVVDNIFEFKPRMNQHVNDSGTYENYFHKKSYDTFNCPERLKK